MVSFSDAWLVSKNSDVPCVLLATLTHPLFGVIRMVRDNADLISRGETFTKSYFDFDFPNDDDVFIKCNFMIPNIDPETEILLRRIIDPVDVCIEAVLTSNPDDPIRRVARLELRNIDPKPLYIVGELTGKDGSSEPAGKFFVNPTNNRSLFMRRG